MGEDQKTTMTTAKKPVTRRVITTPAAWGIKPEIAVTIYPDGEIGLRELGRKTQSHVRIDIGELYVYLVRQRVARLKREKMKNRKKRH